MVKRKNWNIVNIYICTMHAHLLHTSVGFFNVFPVLLCVLVYIYIFFSKLRNRKADGVDNIPGELLTVLGNSKKRELYDIFKDIYAKFIAH